MPNNTTSTTIAVTPSPAAPASYDEWGAYKLAFGGVVAFVIALNVFVSFVKGMMEFFEKKKAADKEKNMPSEQRLVSLERATSNFRPSEYLDKEFGRIEDKIIHNKNNQALMNDHFNDQLSTTQREVNELKLNAAMLKGKVDVLSENTGRLETKVDTLRDRIEERFDRLTEHLVPPKV